MTESPNFSGDTVEADVKRRVQVITASTKPVGAKSELYFELRISGDDAIDLLEGIARNYNITFAGFEFEAYFPNETEAFWHLWGSRFGLCKPKFKSFTVQHLMAVVRRREWFEPCDES